MTELATDDLEPSNPLLSKQRWPYLILGVTSTLVVIMMIFTLHYASSSKRVITDLQIYTWQVDKVDALLIHLLKAETGARGYLVTGDIKYLEPYIEAVSNMGSLLEDIDSQVTEEIIDIADYQELKRLIKAELSSLSQSIHARQNSQHAPEELFNEAKRIMDTIRYTIDSMRTRLATHNASYFIESLDFVNHTRWIYIALFSGAFILLFSLFIVMQRQVVLRRRLSTLLSNEKTQLESLVQQRTRELSDLASYLTRMNETEKRNIAQELHDEMGALLTAAKMDASWIKRGLVKNNNDDDPLHRLERLCKTLDTSIQLKRKITTNLKPPLLHELGLIESLRAMAEDLAMDNEYQVQINLPESLPKIDDERALALFRIAQESLTNARKYSKADTIEIKLSVHENMITLEIIDDGVGFDSKSAPGKTHGITGMRHRTQMFGGSLTIQTSRGNGTHIIANIPVSNSEAQSH